MPGQGILNEHKQAGQPAGRGCHVDDTVDGIDILDLSYLPSNQYRIRRTDGNDSGQVEDEGNIGG